MTLIPTYLPPAPAGEAPHAGPQTPSAERGSVEEAVSLDDLKERYGRYLGDESKVIASAAAGIAFPASLGEISAVLRERAARRQTTTTSAARTGIAAGAVPDPNSAILSVEKMQRIGPVEVCSSGEATVWVEAGVPLLTLREHLQEHSPGWVFPVDPTETWAAIGGMTATNASGARSFGYGAMREWVLGVRAVLADGRILDIRRGDVLGSSGTLSLAGDSGMRTLTVQEMPKPKTKNTLGYSLGRDVDLIDVLVGSEGTLCVFAEILLRLTPTPPNILSSVQFFESDQAALDFVAALRAWKDRPLSIEYFDGNSLELLRKNKNVETSPLLKIAGKAKLSAVYSEIVYADEEEFLAASERLAEAAEKAGGDPERSFAGIEERDVRELKAFRHALPEEINSTIARRKARIPALHKLATDMAVPDSRLHDIFFKYQQTLDAAGLEYVIFGHAGNNHFHVNMLPRSEAELVQGKEMYREFAKQVVAWQGAVAAEHGIGRLKKGFLHIQYPPAEREILRSVKTFFDPEGFLNPGVLID